WAMMSRLTQKFRTAADALLNYRSLPLLSSILFILILCGTIYIIYQNAGIMRDRINEDFNQQQLILARQASGQVSVILHDIELEIDGLARKIARFPDPGDIQTVFNEAASRMRNKGLLELGLADSTRKLIQVTSTDTAAQLEETRLFRDCVDMGTEKTSLGQLYVETLSENYSLITGVICKMIVTLAGRQFLYAQIDVSRLVTGVTQEIRSGKTGYAWVIDETGMFIYHPEREFIGKNAFTARYQRKPYVSFTQINDIMRNQMLKGEEGTGIYESGWHRGIEGQITKLIAFTPIKSGILSKSQVWSVAVAAPTSEIAGAVRGVYIRHFAAEAAIIAAMLLFGVVVVIYQQRISHALKERVSQQEEFISSILQNSVDAIIFIDNDNRVKVWNRGAEIIFGYTAKEMIGQTFHRLVPPDIDADEELLSIQEEVTRQGYIRNYRAQRMTKDGKRITIDLSRTIIRSPHGEILGSTAIIKDVTEKMELEQRIYNTEKLASIGILAAGVAHEINNPLAVILGFTDLLLERFQPGTQEYEDLKMIEANANQAKKTVENMLGFARITEGLEEFVDVDQALNTVIKIVRNTLMTKKVEVALHIPVSLPKVRCDSREFQQVIFNLINNSFAAMEPGGGKLTISVRRQEDSVQIAVEDTGKGIPDKIKPRIFDPFFTTKKVGEGTGLGLSLCYGIIKKYGGKIEFSSTCREDNPQRPSGTKFVISLPVHDTGESLEES
ncbi:MAG: ATP-binding protein, partial [Candidatus Zixiibacteriota bacterium]